MENMASDGSVNESTRLQPPLLTEIARNAVEQFQGMSTTPETAARRVSPEPPILSPEGTIGISGNDSVADPPSAMPQLPVSGQLGGIFPGVKKHYLTRTKNDAAVASVPNGSELTQEIKVATNRKRKRTASWHTTPKKRKKKVVNGIDAAPKVVKKTPKREVKPKSFDSQEDVRARQCLRPRPSQIDHLQSFMLQSILEAEAGRNRRKKSKTHAKKDIAASRPVHLKDLKDLKVSVVKVDDQYEIQRNTVVTKPKSSERKTKLLPVTNGAPRKMESLRSQSRINYNEVNLERNSLEAAVENATVAAKKKETEKIDLELKKARHIPPKRIIPNVTTFEGTVGSLVWAKLALMRWWPAMVICGADCGMDPAKPQHVWVFWYGDHKISEMPMDKLVDFATSFRNKYSEGGVKLYKLGVGEAIRECAVRSNSMYADATLVELLKWAMDGFTLSDSSVSVPAAFQPDPENPVPENVRTFLSKIKQKNLFYYHRDELGVPYVEPTPAAHGRRSSNTTEQKENAMLLVRSGEKCIDDVCISCNSFSVNVIGPHPIFEGGICQRCSNELVEAVYAYGDDGFYVYCTICSNTGELLMCDNHNCNRVFCTDCLEAMTGSEALAKVRGADPWFCYLCNDYDEFLNDLLRKRDNWQLNILKLFQPRHTQPVPKDIGSGSKRPIRVLSLFDGIAIGRLALEQLNVEVDEYFTSEVNPDAVRVAEYHFGSKLTHLGHIETLLNEKIASLCPIDLVLGGSPCNDLTIVNAARKGPYEPSGTGRLFFDFFRILRAVQTYNKGHHTFWLYENVASMPLEYRKVINRFLGCEPAVLDASFFSAQSRARFFWGNIPGLYDSLQPHVVQQNISVLGKSEDSKTEAGSATSKPAEETADTESNKEENDTKLVELERRFGFPPNYTKCTDLTTEKRQLLLGRAWTVKGLLHILSPLKYVFLESQQEKEQSKLNEDSPLKSDESTKLVTETPKSIL